MGFFKDFKEDLSQAVSELSDDAGKLMGKSAEDEKVIDDDAMVDTLMEDEEAEIQMEQSLKNLVNSLDDEPAAEEEDDSKAFEEDIEEEADALDDEPEISGDVASDETTIITPGLAIKGDITCNGSIELLGKVEGNVTCRGKLVVSGAIEGNSASSDFFADKARITGDINCEGPAKIGNGSVIIGNLVATSAVIAGAIKGDIDVHGPVIVDTTAIVMGNIKSKLVQINNGAVLEGYVSQCYSDNSPKKFFGNL